VTLMLMANHGRTRVTRGVFSIDDNMIFSHQPWPPPPSPTQPFRQHPGHESTPNDSHSPILRYYGGRFSIFRLVPERRSSYAATATCVDGETPMAIADILVIQSVREGLYAAETTIQGGLTMSLADGRVKYCYCRIICSIAAASKCNHEQYEADNIGSYRGYSGDDGC
jgi:hypothetical protein